MAENTRHIGTNLRTLRQLRGIKQIDFAKKMGMSQQNISKMEKKAKPAEKRIEDAAKLLGTTVKVIKEFNEKAIFNSNIAFEENSGQTNNISSTKEIIEYFKGELKKRDNEIKELKRQIETQKENKDMTIKSEGSKLS